MRAFLPPIAMMCLVAAGICSGAEELEVGLSGQRMHVTPTRRGILGNRPYAHAGEVAVGKLSAKSTNNNNVKSAELGLKVLDVDTAIDGLTARTTVTHVFQNETDELLEGVFSFALPSAAAVDRFAMTIRGESDLMEGELMEKSQAKSIYSNLVYGVGIDPGVLEWVDGNLFRATIFPIPPKETKTIVVSYLETLPCQLCGSHLNTTYRYPLFQKGQTSKMPPASQVRLHTVVRNVAQGTAINATLNPHVKSGETGTFTLSTVLDGEVATPEDWAITLQTNAPVSTATQGKTEVAASDDELVIQARSSDPNTCIFRAHRPDTKNDGSFALTIVPEMANIQQPKEVDVIFMLDTSSSRSRASLAASIELIRAAIESLNIDDRFALVSFDVTTRVLPGGLQQPFERNVERAFETLKSTLPMGATDVAGAFKMVEKIFARTARPNTFVVYLGDADASYGETNPEAVQKQLEQTLSALSANIFAVYSGPRLNGVADPAARPNVREIGPANIGGIRDATALNLHARGMETLANFTGGPVIELASDVRPADAGRTLIHSLGAPILSHAKLEVTSDDGTAIECTPQISGGITLDRAYTAYGRFAKEGRATAVLSGKLKGQDYRRAWTVEFPKLEESNGAVEKLWARARLGQLNISGDAAAINEAMKLALTHHILSQNTAFLVLESEQLYGQFRIARNTDHRPNANELRSRMLAGTPAPAEAQGIESADAQTAGKNIRISTKGPLANSSASIPVTIGNTRLKVSLQDVKIIERPEKPKPTDPVLTHRQVLERRVGLSRLIAAERGLPFEPEIVFPKIWLDAIGSASKSVDYFANNEIVSGSRRENGRENNILADERVWAEVLKQPVSVPAWRTKLAQPDFSEEHIDRLLNTEKPSQITFSADNSALALDTHLFAHQIIGDLLMDKNAPQHYKAAAGPSEVLRVISTRRAITYSLKGVEPRRLCAAWNFLAELALIEHQNELAAKMADRAIDASATLAANGDPVCALSHMIYGLSAQMSGDYKEASKHFSATLAGTRPLMKGAHALTYSALVTTMAIGGNIEGAINVLERWCSSSYSPEISLRLGEAYQLAHRREDAIRALSIPVEFGQDCGAEYKLPEDFLKRLRPQ